MTDVQIQVFITVLSGLFVTLGFLIKYLINSHASTMKALAERISAQNVEINATRTLIDHKTESLNHVFTSRCKEIEGTIKSDAEIIAVINGKYTPRRDFDMMVAQRSEWRELLMDRLNKSDELIERMRRFRDHDYGDDQTAIRLKISELDRTLAVLENTLSHFCK